MRYRKLSRRFAEIGAVTGPFALGDPWSGVFAFAVARPEWRPPSDLYETRDALIVRVEIAGVAESDLDVTLYEDTLVVEGSRPWSPERDTRYHEVEIHYGPFRLEVPVPAPVDREAVTARFDRGLLEIRLPKTEVRA